MKGRRGSHHRAARFDIGDTRSGKGGPGSASLATLTIGGAGGVVGGWTGEGGGTADGAPHGHRRGPPPPLAAEQRRRPREW